jgi:hypothetical protein
VEFLNVIENTLGSIADQGIMFWSATGAVALGVTLILAAAYIQVHRIRSKSALPVTPDLAEKPAPVEMPVEVMVKPELKNDYQKPLVWLGTATGEAYSEELSLLLARLRKAADRLDGYQRSNGQHPVDSAESQLKESREGVDYLIRTGTG